MADIQEEIVQINAHKEYGDAIRATISEIHSSARYNTGWCDADFRYEQPQFILVLESAIGCIHADTSFTDITDGNCYELLNSLTDVTVPEDIDVRQLIGETVYITPDENLQFATLWPTEDTDNTYDSSHSVCLWEPDESRLDKMNQEDRTITYDETRTLDWLNKHIRLEYERYVEPYNGWIERDIGAVKPVEDQIEVQIPLASDWCARWKFADSFKGRQSVREFATDINRPPDVDELEGSTVYLHPVRNLHHKLPRTEFPLDSLERWVIAGEPQTPDTAKDSLLTRVVDFLSPSKKPQASISINSNSRTRRAKSSDKYDTSDDCRHSSI